VRLKATRENAIGPPAWGTPKVPDEINQRSSDHRFDGTSACGLSSLAPEGSAGSERALINLDCSLSGVKRTSGDDPGISPIDPDAKCLKQLRQASIR
jgi:hypothetical protein